MTVIRNIFRRRISPTIDTGPLAIPAPPPSAKVTTRDTMSGARLSPADIQAIDNVMHFTVANLDLTLRALDVCHESFLALDRQAAAKQIRRVMVELSAVRQGPVMAIADSSIPPRTAEILRMRRAQDDCEALT
jgi:hypothetical protein